MRQVKVYGTEWCEDTQHTLDHLDVLGVRYDYVNIDEDERGRQWVEKQNGGKQRTPTLDVDGLILTEPDDPELDAALRSHGLLA